MTKGKEIKLAHTKVRSSYCLIYRAFSTSLLFVMILLPLAPIFADETGVLETANDVSVSSETTGEVSEEQNGDEGTTDEVHTDEEQSVEDVNVDVVENNTKVISAETMEEEVTQQGDTSNDTQEVVVIDDEVDTRTTTQDEALVSENIDETTLSDETPTDEEADSSEDEVVDEQSVETEEITEVETLPDTTTPETPPVGTTEEIVDTTDEPELSHEETNTASTTETRTLEESTVVVNTLTNDENKFSFGENECTTVGDGTFYCTKAELAPEIIHTDRIFSAVDADGDKEIYVEKEGDLAPITDNQVDDDAPYYDEVSNTAVWHRLIDGRYQIIEFDFDKEEETQLTSDRFNNMQPSRYGDVTVWQGWVGNDWEIFLSVDDELSMITDNTTHDITPSVSATHVVWQAFENDAWRMKVYDIRTKDINTIEDAEGGSIENPRFVLVYDTKFASGDIETRGYDLKSGEVVHLASEPTSVPDEIPDPDQTGEERAFVTQSTQPKPKSESDEGGDVPQDPTIGSGSGDIVIPPLTDSAASSTSVSGSDIADDEIQNDVVIPPFESDSVSSETSHIEDVVVEPYFEVTATTTVPQ